MSAIAGQTLSIGSNILDTYEVVNDTKIRVSYPALAAGSYPVTVTDNLGLADNLDSLVIVDQAHYSYEEISALYSKSLPVYDPVRKALYTVDFVNDDLHVFDHDSGSWSDDAVNIEDAEQVSLSNDGQSLIITSSDVFNKLYRLEPDSLAALYQGTPYLGRNYSFGDMATVSDGRTMIGTSTGAFILFDPSDNSHIEGSELIPGYGKASTSSAVLAGSLDGDRVFAGRTGSVTDNAIKIFDMSDVSVITTSVSKYVKALATTRDGSILAINPADGGTSEIYDVSDTDISLLGSLHASLEAIALGPDGSQAYAFDYIDGSPAQFLIRIYDLDSPDGSGGFNNTSYALKDSQGGVNFARLSVSPDGNTLFLGTTSHLVIWPIP